MKTCIIGGGFAGLATSIGLAERNDYDQILVEQHRIGWGASGRNGGFVFGGFSLEPEPLARRLGLAKAKGLYQQSVAAVNTIRKRIRSHKIACDSKESGVLLVDWFDRRSQLEQQLAFMNQQMGVNWQFMDRSQVTDLVASERYYDALVEPNAFHFHPLKYAQGLSVALQNQGVAVHEQTQVLSIEKGNNGYKIITPEAEISAENVVLACGGYQANLIPKISRAVLPIATYIVVTEPLSTEQKQLIKTDMAIYDTRFAFDYYRLLSDDRLLWGGRITVYEPDLDAIKKKLKKDLAKVYPGLADVKIDYTWSGFMSYARHHMPQIGCIDKGLWYAQAFGGHGVTPTTVAGEVIAAAIAEQDTAYEDFAPFGLNNSFSWIGKAAAQSVYWYQQCKDAWQSPK